LPIEEHPGATHGSPATSAISRIWREEQNRAPPRRQPPAPEIWGTGASPKAEVEVYLPQHCATMRMASAPTKPVSQFGCGGQDTDEVGVHEAKIHLPQHCVGALI
jgi:hypothetical protein